MVFIEARALGRKQPLVPQWSVPVSRVVDGSDSLTLRALIGAVVRSEVAAFEERREARYFLRALSADEIEEAGSRGKVDMGGPRRSQPPADPDVAAATALQAFVDGMFLVIIDEEECRALDQVVRVTASSRVTFLRLTFLAGA